MTSFLEPELAARYQDLLEIGRGGMGRVFKAWDTQLERHVAIKVLSAGEFGGGGVQQRFLEEGRICSTLEHPSIVRLYDCGIPAGDFPPYMVFEFVEGRSLEARLKEGPLPPAEALDVLIAVAEGLAHAHRAGIVHRDLKPENILLDTQGRARVADFGLAKDRGSASGVRTRQGILLGTPPYMAPEYIKGSSMGPPADQYALGVLAFQLLTGKLPYDSPDNVTILRMHLKEPVPDPRDTLPDLDPELAEDIARAMAKAPEDRFPSVEALASRMRQRRDPLQQSLLAMRRPGRGARADRRATTVPLQGLGATLTGVLGDPGTHQGRSRRRRVAALGGVAILGTGLLLALRAPPVEASKLVVEASPRALEARWNATGATSLRIEELGGGPVLSALAPSDPGRCRVRAAGLEPGREYLVSVRAPSGQILQQVHRRTPPDEALPPPRLELVGAPPLVHLRSRGHYPFALTWTLVRRRGDTWAPAAEGGDATALRPEHDLILPDVDPGERIQLRCRQLPAGSDLPLEHVLLDDRSVLRERAEAVMAPLVDGGAEVLGQALDRLQEELRTRVSVDALHALEEAGVPAEVRGLLQAATQALGDPRVPLLEKLAVERSLLHLEDLDVLLRGNDRPGITGFRRLRQAYLPFGKQPTLGQGARLLAPAWRSRVLAPERTEEPDKVFFTDPFLEGHLKGGRVSGILEFEVRSEDLRRYQEDGRRVRLDFPLAAAPRPGSLVELALVARHWTTRHRLLLAINDAPEVVLWSAGEKDALDQDILQGQTTYYRIPAEFLRAGPNRLSFRVDTLVGKDGTMVTLHLLGASLQGGP